MKPIKSLFPLIAVALATIAQSNPVDAAELQDAVKSYLVSEDGSNRMTPSVIRFDDGTSAVDGTITLNPTDARQPIDGFGFAITGSAAYNLLKMKPEERQALLTRIFRVPKGMAAHMCVCQSDAVISH